jgi:hypothetical protein
VGRAPGERPLPNNRALDHVEAQRIQLGDSGVDHSDDECPREHELAVAQGRRERPPEQQHGTRLAGDTRPRRSQRPADQAVDLAAVGTRWRDRDQSQTTILEVCDEGIGGEARLPRRRCGHPGFIEGGEQRLGGR